MKPETKELLVNLAECAAWCAVITAAFCPDAMAAMPIPGWDRMVNDTQDAATNQGGLIMGVGGGAISAFKMVFSGGEFGMGNLIRTGGGCAIAGSVPALAPYFTQ